LEWEAAGSAMDSCKCCFQIHDMSGCRRNADAFLLFGKQPLSSVVLGISVHVQCNQRRVDHLAEASAEALSSQK